MVFSVDMWASEKPFVTQIIDLNQARCDLKIAMVSDGQTSLPIRLLSLWMLAQMGFAGVQDVKLQPSL